MAGPPALPHGGAGAGAWASACLGAAPSALQCQGSQQRALVQSCLRQRKGCCLRQAQACLTAQRLQTSQVDKQYRSIMRTTHERPGALQVMAAPMSK